MRIPLFKPFLSEKGLREVNRILRSGMWAASQGGPQVKELERKFAEYVGCTDAVAVNSGSAALHLALKITGTTPDREVLLPSLTFISTVHAVALTNRKPVFVDVGEDTLNMDVEDLKSKITSHTVGIVPVHFGGRPCDIHAINDLAEDHGLWVIDDCSHACASTYAGKPVGSLFDRGCFSLHPVKPVASLGGGIITLPGPQPYVKGLKTRLETLRFCGVNSASRQGPVYDSQRLGWNYYMSELSAAVALDSLSRADCDANMRRSIGAQYTDAFRDLPAVETLPFDHRSTYHLFILKVKSQDKFIYYMRTKGIEVGVHYAKGCHQYSYYKTLKASLPVTEKLVKQVVSIPIYPGLKKTYIKYIVDAVQRWKS